MQLLVIYICDLSTIAMLPNTMFIEYITYNPICYFYFQLKLERALLLYILLLLEKQW